MKKPTKQFTPELPTLQDQLDGTLDGLERILHPNLFMSIRGLINRRISEVRQEERDKKIDPRVQEVIKTLQDCQNSLIGIYNGGYIRNVLWHLRPAFRLIMQLYGPRTAADKTKQG